MARISCPAQPALDFSIRFRTILISLFFEAGSISRPAVKARNLESAAESSAREWKRLNSVLPDQLYLKREPRPLLADFFLAADRFAAERGVLLSISTDFDELRAVNRRNRDSWVPLLPSISTDYNDMREHAAFWLKGASEADGDVVLARACRLYDLPANKTMHDALVDLSLF